MDRDPVLMSLKNGLSNRVIHDDDETVKDFCISLKYSSKNCSLFFDFKDSITKLSNISSPLGPQVRLCRTHSLSHNAVSKSHSLPLNAKPLVSVLYLSFYIERN